MIHHLRFSSKIKERTLEINHADGQCMNYSCILPESVEVDNIALGDPYRHGFWDVSGHQLIITYIPSLTLILTNVTIIDSLGPHLNHSLYELYMLKPIVCKSVCGRTNFSL